MSRPAARPQPSRSTPSTISADRVWQRRFLVAILMMGVISLAFLGYQRYSEDVDEGEAYVSVQTRTVAGSFNNVVCKLSLLVDQDQEDRINRRKGELEAVVKSVLAEAYQGERRPSLAEVRDRLHLAINNKLPRRLQVQDVLIQELVIGSS